MARIDAFLQLAREQGCSDIHFAVGLPPMVRLDGDLAPLKYRELSHEELELLFTEILPTPRMADLERSGAIDLSYAAPELGRFRLNVFRQRRGLSAICRVIPLQVPAIGELGLPAVVAEFSRIPAGLVLVTGGPGTGKTTTLAALVNEINSSRNCTVIALEDPIEFEHECRQALVIQREIGRHVGSFHEGLCSALRQDPEVLLIGELREPATIAAAVEASETGHLVFGTLHTRGAHQTIHRMVDAFPAEAQAQLRQTLADNLQAIVSQELVRAADGRGRRVVAEILMMTPAIAQMIREGKTHQIPSAMATGRRLGMQLMDQALLALVQSGEIDPNEAFLKAGDKREFVFHVTQPELLKLAEPGPASPAAAEA